MAGTAKAAVGWSTVTVWVMVPVSPRSSVTVRRTVYTPGATYWWLATELVPVSTGPVPSLKRQV